jgi:hypothetical protein
LDIVVSLSDIELGKERAACESVDDLRDKWRDVPVVNGPFIEGSVVLYRPEFTIFLFYEEEVRCIRAFGFADSTTPKVLLHKLVAFHNLFLSKWKESSGECGWSSRQEFNGMVPNGMGWQSLGILFTEYLCMPMVFCRDFCHSVLYGLRVTLGRLDDGPSDVEVLLAFLLLSL